ncbi:hypothetical protein KY290_012731 [Solanum tuberosum]|uniref:Retrovirus-related Pol polyprotein from transposon TNT 1-94-like beta-barrel domain-containing protein n=1 Tax=Solanum tuberosum TaxID=4113 RepID=A0ABQ7VLY5_SOLTU|nr:hypothetical protein KY285_012603 [Solanum tuberosum]KAH0768750.1 hypothetical protein KY290_012731 [Solanum tuberosum]
MVVPATTSDSDAAVPTTTHVVQFNPAAQLPIKLHNNLNFATWKAQLVMLLNGHKLLGHLIGAKSAPPTTITQTDSTISNPEYELWFCQDQLILQAMTASVDPTIAPTVATASSTKIAWDLLHTTYANRSHTCIFSLRDQLQNMKKDSNTIATYMHEIRSIDDALKVVGFSVVDDELAVKILSGLGHESSSIIMVAVAQRTNFQPQHYKNNCRFPNQSSRPQAPRQADPGNQQNGRLPRQAVNFVSNHHSDVNPWILDSGATHHVTTESANLEEYTGNEEVSMGDDKTIHITHTGLTQIKASNSNFMLSNTLCAPAIKKNLIFVAKFCTDNLTSIEFFQHSFIVKDLNTRRLLVQGRNKHGLYEWPQRDHVSPSTNFTSTKVSRQLWHRRLESQVGKDTHPRVQLNLDSNLVPTLLPPIPITLTVPSHSNTPESIIERQLPAVSTSSGMIPIFSQPPPLFNEVAHNTSQPLYYSHRPPINQQPPQHPAIMSPATVPPPTGVVTRYILDILSDVDMANCKGVTTPMCSTLPPKAGDGSPPADATLYRRTIVYAIPKSGTLESSKKGALIPQGILNVVPANL